MYRGISGKERQRRAARALTMVGLGARLRNHPSQLSGGQQQRVAIARALVTEPEVLLADEPTGNLDSASAAEVLGLLRELKADGQTLVLVTHDARVAASADRVLAMRDGLVVDETRLEDRQAPDAVVSQLLRLEV